MFCLRVWQAALFTAAVKDTSPWPVYLSPPPATINSFKCFCSVCVCVPVLCVAYVCVTLAFRDEGCLPHCWLREGERDTQGKKGKIQQRTSEPNSRSI